MIYHFIGIKGTGMGALAQFMFDLGYNVQGSDKTEHRIFYKNVLYYNCCRMSW